MKTLFETAQEQVIENAIIGLLQNDTDYFSSSIEERLKNITAKLELIKKLDGTKCYQIDKTLEQVQELKTPPRYKHEEMPDKEYQKSINDKKKQRLVMMLQAKSIVDFVGALGISKSKQDWVTKAKGDRKNGQLFLSLCSAGHLNDIKEFHSVDSSDAAGPALEQEAKWWQTKDIEDDDLLSWFIMACAYGHRDVCKFVLDIRNNDQTTQILIANDAYWSFIVACRYGHFEVAELLLKNCASEMKQEMICAQEYKAYRHTCINGYIEIAKLLLANCAPEKIQEMINSKHCFAFIDTCRNGHFEVVELLLENGNKQEMINSINYLAFKETCGNGHLKVAELLLEKCAPEKIQEMINSINYLAFRVASGQGHIEIVKLLLENCAHDNRQEMIKSAFNDACDNGHVEVAELLLEKCAPEKIQEMINSINYLAFRAACINKNIAPIGIVLFQYVHFRMLP